MLQDQDDDLSAEPIGHDDPDDPEAARKAKIVADARSRFALVHDLEHDQREREKDDLKFDRALPEDQWPDYILKERKGGVVNGKKVAPRPCLVIPKLDQPIQQVINEAQQARLGIVVKAKGGTANTRGAELRQGMIRAIEVDSVAQNARMWALKRAVKCGRGYYRVLTDYANDGDFDLDIQIKRILNQGSVYLDPYATEEDWSDGLWALIIEDLGRDEYKRRYPKSNISNASTDQWEGLLNKYPHWCHQDDRVRIAEYFYVDFRERTLITDPATGKARLLRVAGETFKDDAGNPVTQTDDEVLPPGARSRTVQQRVVKWCVVNAVEVLDEQDWPGRYIPIIPVLGKEYVVDGEERVYKGMVSNSKDSQRSFNYMRSAQVEAVGLAPKAPYVAAEGQIDDYKEMWDTANVANYSVLIYKPTDYMGNPVPPPQRNVQEPAIQAITMAVREADADIKATTGRFDPSLGAMSSERSGRAIKELKQQGENSSSNYLENLANVSMTYEARVLLDLLPKIYDRPGRVVRLLGEEEGDEKHVILGQDFQRDEDGQPRLLSTLAMRPAGPTPGQPEVERWELNPDEDYMAQVTVGRAAPTERQANIDLLQGLVESTKGAAAPMLLDIIAEQMEGPIAKRVAKRIRKMNPNLDDDGQVANQPTVEQVAQLQMQLQQASMALQQAQQQLAIDGAKQQAQVQIAQMEIASKEKIEFNRIRADIAKTRATLDSKEAMTQLELEEDRLAREAELAGKLAIEHVKGLHKEADTDGQIALEHARGENKRREVALGAALTPKKDGSAGPHARSPVRDYAPSSDVPAGPSGAAHDPRLG